MKNILTIVLILFTWTSYAHARLQSRTVEYKHGDAILQGYLAYDDSFKGKRPGVLIVHQWKGFSDYVVKRANQLAKLGFVAFALDMYGKDVRATNHEEAAGLSGIYFNDRKLMRDRARAGLDILLKEKKTDKKKLAAIGYCFGGTTVLEMARGGLNLRGVVSFHGVLNIPTPTDPKLLRAKILILHGANDTYTSKEQLERFEADLKQANADWQMISYGGAVHSFTVPEAGNDPTKGAAYNKRADERSWRAMLNFFDEILD